MVIEKPINCTAGGDERDFMAFQFEFKSTFSEDLAHRQTDTQFPCSWHAILRTVNSWWLAKSWSFFVLLRCRAPPPVSEWVANDALAPVRTASFVRDGVEWVLGLFFYGQATQAQRQRHDGARQQQREVCGWASPVSQCLSSTPLPSLVREGQSWNYLSGSGRSVTDTVLSSSSGTLSVSVVVEYFKWKISSSLPKKEKRIRIRETSVKSYPSTVVNVIKW